MFKKMLVAVRPKENIDKITKIEMFPVVRYTIALTITEKIKSAANRPISRATILTPYAQ